MEENGLSRTLSLHFLGGPEESHEISNLVQSVSQPRFYRSPRDCKSHILPTEPTCSVSSIVSHVRQAPGR
jgi:hypothetical protein